jgi:hypothetical protein
MSTNEGTARGGGILSTIGALLSILMTILVIGAVILIARPYLANTPLPAILTLPTADVVRQQPSGSTVVNPRTLPAINPGGTYNSQADADAAYATAIAVPQVINNTGDTSPLVRQQKPADRPAPPPPGEASVQEEPASDAFGSKPVGGPINIQETHQCLHGQVWTDTGCHRPTPTP